jgi:ABC-type multidrug transport system ATPase subunit
MLMKRSERGVCTIVATNEPALAQALATRVVLLNEGEVVADGSPAELLAKVGGATRIEVHVTGSLPTDPTGPPSGTPPPPGTPTTAAPALDGLPADIVSIQQLPGRIIAESTSGPDVLPQLVGAVLGAGLKIERIEIREPDLTDVFTLFTGQALSMGSEASGTGSPAAVGREGAKP